MEKLFAAIGKGRCVEVLELLLERDRTSKELSDELGANPGTLSKWTDELVEAGLLGKDKLRSPFRVLYPDSIRALLLAAALLEEEVLSAKQRKSTERINRLSKTGMHSAGVVNLHHRR